MRCRVLADQVPVDLLGSLDDPPQGAVPDHSQTPVDLGDLVGQEEGGLPHRAGVAGGAGHAPRRAGLQQVEDLELRAPEVGVDSVRLPSGADVLDAAVHAAHEDALLLLEELPQLLVAPQHRPGVGPPPLQLGEAQQAPLEVPVADGAARDHRRGVDQLRQVRLGGLLAENLLDALDRPRELVKDLGWLLPDDGALLLQRGHLLRVLVAQHHNALRPLVLLRLADLLCELEVLLPGLVDNALGLLLPAVEQQLEGVVIAPPRGTSGAAAALVKGAERGANLLRHFLCHWPQQEAVDAVSDHGPQGALRVGLELPLLQAEPLLPRG
mmetsp:Transcript_27281/g.72054  ORF Transcript_27281/g.72054 Transcript_27281/m.72054 type:complete len:325 (-) Transcript_27281:226-1200(-)